MKFKDKSIEKSEKKTKFEFNLNNKAFFQANFNTATAATRNNRPKLKICFEKSVREIEERDRRKRKKREKKRENRL